MAQVKLLSALTFDAGTFEEEGIADPAIRVLGELPGTTEPFHIHRVYKGAAGTYEETVLLLDPDGLVIWERPSRYVRLRGEMFEDLFRTEVDEDVEITSVEEHTTVFLMNGVEVGRVPTFIHAPQSARSMGVLDEAVETALKKGSIVWVSIPQPDDTTVTRPAWYVQDGRSLYVLTGPREQSLPHLGEAGQVHLTVKSKEVQAAIGTMPADVRVVDNASEEFDRIAARGLGERLNLPDGRDALERWRETCLLVELTPEGG